MASFRSLPFELRKQILDDLLPFEDCRRKFDLKNSFVQPIDGYTRNATNVVLVWPFLEEQVAQLCQAHWVEREKELTQYNNECLARLCTCGRYRGEATFRIPCHFCECLNREKQKLKDAAGHPEESCEKLRFLMQKLETARSRRSRRHRYRKCRLN